LAINFHSTVSICLRPFYKIYADSASPGKFGYGIPIFQILVFTC
jgi:hypothetical protein